MLDPETLDRAAKVLVNADEVTLACHVNPDADAIGSMLGLGNHLRSRGVKVVAAAPNRFEDLPRWVEALPGRELLVPPGKLPKAPKLVVTFDAADLARLDGLSHLIEKAETSICIDHHRTNPGFATINLIDADASSTAELVYRVIQHMGDEADADAAACIYAGLVTDTGRFQYQSASPDVLRLAAELRERPFDHARLTQALYEDGSVAYLKLLGVVLDRVQHIAEANLVWTYATRKDLDQTKVPIQETDDMIDIIRMAREADVAAVLKEQRAGGFKVSMRSRGDTNVAEIAEAFGGGGHRLAAGYSAKGSLEEASRALIEALVQVNPASAAP
jgi:phosphoesterase RecJ-like protein